MTQTAFQSLTSSKSSEWYTPKYIITDVKKVLGEIDLDPASNTTANSWICAKNIYTKEDDGYIKPWYGKIFLNPPYGQASKKTGNYGSSAWLIKAWEEYTKGNVIDAIIIARGDSTGLKHLMQRTIFCEADRISFVFGCDVNRPNSPVPGTKIFYLGKDWALFNSVFNKHGIILRAA